MSTTLTQTKPRRALPPLMTVSDAAAERLRGLYAKGQEGMLLRIAISTKGCSGMSYDMSWVAAAGPGDEVVTDNGVTVLVDRKATLFLIGWRMRLWVLRRLERHRRVLASGK